MENNFLYIYGNEKKIIFFFCLKRYKKWYNVKNHEKRVKNCVLIIPSTFYVCNFNTFRKLLALVVKTKNNKKCASKL